MSFVWFFLLIGGLITVHELGHLGAAKLLGIRVLKVSIGFGPPLATFYRGETEYTLSWVPLGGYVRLLGEEPSRTVPDEERHRSFSLRPAWQRLLVILAGPAANLVVPIVLFIYIAAGQTTALSSTIGTVFDGQPAAQADLRPGDRVVAIDDEPVRFWDELNERILRSPGRPLRITVERAADSEQRLTKYVTPRLHTRGDLFGQTEEVGLIGISPYRRLPRVGVVADSAAYRAGLRTFDRIIAIQGRAVQTPADLAPVFAPRSGAMVLVTYLRPVEGTTGPVARLRPATAQVLPTIEAIGAGGLAGPIGRPRYRTGLEPADLYVYSVEPRTVAAALGLQPGDALLELDHNRLSSWEELVQVLEERPTSDHRLRWRSRAGERVATFRLEPRRQLDEYQAEATRYLLGAQSVGGNEPVAEELIEHRFSTALERGCERAMAAIVLMSRALGRTLLGRLPVTAVGGPILIYQVAGVAAEEGAAQFLVVAALVSINLGLLNLLPVPLLDGGQATFLFLEALRRRPLSPRTRERASYAGLAILIALMLLAARNDLARHFLT